MCAVRLVFLVFVRYPDWQSLPVKLLLLVFDFVPVSDCLAIAFCSKGSLY